MSDSGIRLGVMVVIGFLLLIAGFLGVPGSILAAIIDPASMTGADPHQSGTGGLPTGGTLDAYQIGQYWLAAYRALVGVAAGNNQVTINDTTTAIAIALAESGGNTAAVNYDSNGTVDRGLWQINSVHTQFNAQKLFDPAYNASAAASIWGASGTWSAWSTYLNGDYRQFLSEAQTAATQVIQDNFK